MLDVSIRIGILNLMLDLKHERNLAFLYVTHDLASARYVADEVLVMYAGPDRRARADRRGAAASAASVHAACCSRPCRIPSRRAGSRLPPRRAQDAAVDPVAGCRFAERCPLAIAACSQRRPSSSRRRRSPGAARHRHRPRHREDPCRRSREPSFPPISSGARRPRRTRSRAPSDEDGRGESIWDRFCATPGKVRNGDTRRDRLRLLPPLSRTTSR